MQEQKYTGPAKILFILFLFWWPYLNAQYKPGSLSNGIIPQVTPSSPEASSLGKFGEWPVSEYTGVPNISVPIYTINVDGFQVPIQLSYHAGGVKMDEVSSWVGTNWTLNAGGSISRTIVGFPDERNLGFLYQNQRGLGLKTFYDIANADDYVTLSRVADGTLDAEPDIFFYNFGGLSGKFYFDQSGNFQTIPAGNLKLIRSPVTTSSYDEHWEIADANGNVYHFASYMDNGNGFEKSGMLQNQYATQFTTSWYLTKVVIANSADIIYFDYTDKNESYELPVTHSFRILTNSEPLNYQYSPPGSLATDVFKVNQVLTNGSTSGSSPSVFGVSGKSMLQKIRWRGGEIQFTASTVRLDIDQGKMLNSIAIFDKAGVKKKDFLLSYLFTQKRYFLQTITESDPTGTNQLAHSFEYLSPSSLPIRGSTGIYSIWAQDHWGFYNGANANPSLLPPNTDIANGYLVANREPNEVYMSYGTLSKITYPTGGHTIFQFEAHRYDPASSVNSGPSSAIAQFTLNCTAGNPQPTGTVRIQNFTVGFAQNSCPITLQFKNYNKPASKEAGWLPTVSIQKLINGTYQEVASWNAYDQFPVGNVPPPNQYGLIDYNLSTVVNFSTGDYRLVTDLVCGQMICGSPAVYPSVVSQLKYFNYNGQPPIAGGLRIKDITSYTKTGSVAGRKRYTYDPGKLLIYPKYEHQYAEYLWPFVYIPHPPGTVDPKSPCFPLYAKYKEITSTSQAILGFTQGAAVGYTSVKEEELNSTGTDNNGYTQYTFTHTADILNQLQYDNSYWPGLTILNAAIPLDNNDYKRGLLKSKEIYKKNADNSSTIVYSLINSYDYNDGVLANRYNTCKGMRVKKVIHFPGGGVCGYSLNGYTIPTGILPTNGSLSSFMTYSFYNLITSWVKLSSSTENKYDAAGSNPVAITTNFTYSNATHLQVTSTTVNNSRGQTIKNDIKYPHDYSTIAPYDQMILRNIISPAIEQVQTNVTLSKILTREKVTYLSWKNNLFIRPSYAEKSVSGNTLETESTINDYDDKGNIIQVTGKDGLIVSHIWGYNQQYPVAKILGKTHALAVSQSGINLSTINNISSTENEIRTELNKLQALTNCFVNTYTYKPLIGITSETDPNGKTVYYTYDALGRVIMIRDKDKKILKKFCYNYAGQTQNCNIYGNSVKSGTYTKACAAGSTGSSVVYTVPSSIYFSTISQADADQQAQNDVIANGQSYANNTGTCTAPITFVVNIQNTTSAYYSVSFNDTYSVSIYPYSTSGITLSAGTYKVSFQPISSPAGNLTFIINGYSSSGTSAIFYGVNIASGSSGSIN